MPNLRCILNVESNSSTTWPMRSCLPAASMWSRQGRCLPSRWPEMGLAMALNIGPRHRRCGCGFSRWPRALGRRGQCQGAAALRRRCRHHRVRRSRQGAEPRTLRFRTQTRVYDPWMPASILVDNRRCAVEPRDVLTKSDFIFVVAAVTSETSISSAPKPLPACGRALPSSCSAAPMSSIRRADGGGRQRPYRCGERCLSR